MMILAVMMVMTISANAMSYNTAKHEALFLSDKMAYEFCLYICLQKRTRGILRNGSSLFTCKTRTLFPSSLHRHSLQVQETG